MTRAPSPTQSPSSHGPCMAKEDTKRKRETKDTEHQPRNLEAKSFHDPPLNLSKGSASVLSKERESFKNSFEEDDFILLTPRTAGFPFRPHSTRGYHTHHTMDNNEKETYNISRESSGLPIQPSWWRKRTHDDEADGEDFEEELAALYGQPNKDTDTDSRQDKDSTLFPSSKKAKVIDYNHRPSSFLKPRTTRSLQGSSYALNDLLWEGESFMANDSSNLYC